LATTSKFNFEFASPFIYHAEDFNILRDGINSEHKKHIVDNLTGIAKYKIIEKLFDVDTFDNTRVNFNVTNTAGNNESADNYITRNVDKTISQDDIEGSYKAKYDAKAGQNFDTWGYVSFIGYNA